jgi:hypothetical protein
MLTSPFGWRGRRRFATEWQRQHCAEIAAELIFIHQSRFILFAEDRSPGTRGSSTAMSELGQNAKNSL